MLDDSERINVTFLCCDTKSFEALSSLKEATIDYGFICKKCGANVKYYPHEFVALINKDPKDAPHELTLYAI